MLHVAELQGFKLDVTVKAIFLGNLDVFPTAMIHFTYIQNTV